MASCYCRRVEPLQILTLRLQLRGLSGSNWVVAPDLKGFGDSDKPFLARQYKDQVADFDLPWFLLFYSTFQNFYIPTLFFFSSTFVKRVVMWCRCWWRSSRSSWMCCRSLAVKTFRLRLILSTGGGEEDHHHWTWSRWPLGLVSIFSSFQEPIASLWQKRNFAGGSSSATRALYPSLCRYPHHTQECG